jgi:two-component system LytT family response regulator
MHIIHNNTLIVSASEATYTLPVVNIIRIQAISNYSKIYLSNRKTITVSKVLHWFETQVCLSSFIRIHRSHLINKNFVQQYQSVQNAGGFAFLYNGEKINISRRRKQIFKEAFLIKGASQNI